MLSEQAPAPLADDAASPDAGLESQLKAIAAERDRHAADKLELIAKASALSKELDAVRAQLDSAAAERDGLRGDLSKAQSEVAKLSTDAGKAAQEVARLKDRLASAPKPDPAVVLGDFAAEKTKAAVAWTRAKIPADSPALPWFDRTVSTVTTVGCVAVKTSIEFSRWLAPRLVEAYAWAKPRALELYAKAKAALETSTTSK